MHVTAHTLELLLEHRHPNATAVDKAKRRVTAVNER
jgi:hypothetical protein